MQFYLLDGDYAIWTKWSGIATIAACIAAILYTIFTYRLLKATSKSVKQTAIANELTVLQSLRSDLTTQIFLQVTDACIKNNLVIDDATDGCKTEGDKLKVTTQCLKNQVINNIEDLAIFHYKGVLEIETIDYSYGNCILAIGNNQVVRDFVNQYHKEADAFGGFNDLYQKIYNKLDGSVQVKYKNSIIEEEKEEREEASE